MAVGKPLSALAQTDLLIKNVALDSFARAFKEGIRREFNIGGKEKFLNNIHVSYGTLDDPLRMQKKIHLEIEIPYMAYAILETETKKKVASELKEANAKELKITEDGSSLYIS